MDDRKKWKVGDLFVEDVVHDVGKETLLEE
jgi:hypothetical protein